MEPTREQYDAVHISDKNLIVVAGAGSGKTRVLVERYLQLLEDNPDWRISALVAITFTREAAFEMRHRLREELEKRTRESGAGHWARHLSQLDSARIDTIHGLCTNLLRANAAQAGVDPRFQVLDENESAILLDDIVHDVLATIKAPLSQLFAHYDSFRIEGALRQLNLVNAELAPVPDDPDALFRQWEREWSDEVFKVRDRLLNSAELSNVVSAGPAPNEDKLAELIAQYWRYLERVENAEDPFTVVQLTKECFDTGAVGNKGSAAAWGGSAAKKEAADSLRDLRARIKDTVVAIGDPPGVLDRATAELLPLWHQLLQKVRTTYRARKQKSALLDFDDLERLAAKLLRDDEVQRRYRGTEFKHLLVDEFQDTNEAQWRIIKSLADLERGGSLFVVGDPKQSIYQFRGADVSTFGKAIDKIAGQEAGCELSLSTSFRSHRPLVEQFNTLFRALLKRDESSPVANIEVKFDKPMQAFRDEAPALPAITIQLLESEELDEAGEYVLGRSGRRQSRNTDDMRRWEAYEISAHIKRMIEDRCPVFDKETREKRAMQYRDIAILFQSMTKLPLYEEVFKSQGISYLAVAGRGYFDRQEVWDLLNLLRFLHNPADNLALATVLRSPIFAFSDDLLFALRLKRDEEADSPTPLPLWRALHIAAEEPLPGIADTDLPLIAHALDTLGELLRLAGRVTISQLLRRALTLTNYPAILTGLPDGNRRRGNIEKLLGLAEESGKITLGKFSQYLADLSAREAREGEALLEPGNTIRLMTVHASKGLEFALVVLADASWERGNSGAPTLQADSKYGLSCSVYSGETNKYEDGFAHRRNLKLQALKEAAERRRLLYVAATRAQDYLLISGAVKQNKSGALNARGWLKLLLPALGIDDAPCEPDERRQFAGYPLRIRMPTAPPPPERLRPAVGAVATLWDYDADADDYPPLMPPLMNPLPEHSRIGPRHISATQIAHLGAYRHEKNPHARRHFGRRFRDIASTGMSQDDYEVTFSPRRHRERLVGRIVHEVLRFTEFCAENAISDQLIRAIAWENGLTNAAALSPAIREIRGLLREYKISEAQRWLSKARAADCPVHTELSFMLRTDERVIHGIVDVLLRRSDDQWVIIDYKTSRVADGAFAEHAKRFRLQLGIYAAAAKEQLGLAESPLTYIHYIRGNQMIELSGQDCQRELDRLESTIGELAVSDAQIE
ncbi:MAG: UvrD-helicase domain-containing protein [Chloroflexi bacterium]|nr:UvrD-helicase domain-containing protein [Chloroflexota bacterium]